MNGMTPKENEITWHCVENSSLEVIKASIKITKFKNMDIKGLKSVPISIYAIIISHVIKPNEFHHLIINLIVAQGISYYKKFVKNNSAEQLSVVSLFKNVGYLLNISAKFTGGEENLFLMEHINNQIPIIMEHKSKAVNVHTIWIYEENSIAVMKVDNTYYLFNPQASPICESACILKIPDKDDLGREILKHFSRNATSSNILTVYKVTCNFPLP